MVPNERAVSFCSLRAEHFILTLVVVLNNLFNSVRNLKLTPATCTEYELVESSSLFFRRQMAPGFA